MAKSTKKGSTGRLQRQTPRAWVTISPELNRRLKIHAATHGTQVRALVEEAVTLYLNALEKGGKPRE